MKRGLNHVRCRTDDSRRAQLAKARSPTGFSLIELLAVVAILLLLVTLYWGSGASTSRQRQAQQDCQTHLQRIYMALTIYAGEHDGKFPAAPGARTSAEALDALVPRYMADTTVFLCPGVQETPPPANRPFRQQQISYAYYMGRRVAEPQQALMSDQQVNAQAKNAGELAFSSTGKPPGNNHGKIGGNFLFGDGSVTPTPPRLPFSIALTQGVLLLNPGPSPP
jgi:prepilin-type N-terminal cleavage/methylation domain-containing protein/prepilin-type processing-associated H-X9-DG protein